MAAYPTQSVRGSRIRPRPVGRQAGQSASSGCGQLSGDSGGCMRRDGTEERVACGPMLGSFNQNITRDADDSARDTRVGRRLLCRLPPGPPTIGGRVGRSATVSRDHTSFVRVVWMEAARRPKRRPVWSSSSPLYPPAPARALPRPSSFLAQNERWIAVFSIADERSTKRGRE